MDGYVGLDAHTSANWCVEVIGDGALLRVLLHAAEYDRIAGTVTS